VRPWRAAPAAGARVALVAPAFALPDGALGGAVAAIEALGLSVAVGPHAACRSGPWAGDADERLADLAWALTAEDVDVAWMARGGEGTAEVAARLPWAAVVARGMPVVGMSDITALHGGLCRRGIPSVHGAMPTTGWDPFQAGAAWRALTAPPPWTLDAPPGAPPPTALRGGVARGPLVGGNLTVLAAIAGTPLAPDTRGAILLLEDVDERAYRLDRCLVQLRLAGMLEGLAGVALGTFTDCPPVAGLTAEAVLERHLRPLGVPVLAGLPLGHGPVQSAVPLGVEAGMDADAGTLTVLEAPFARAGARAVG